jgi:hypothetical protein
MITKRSIRVSYEQAKARYEKWANLLGQFEEIDEDFDGSPEQYICAGVSYRSEVGGLNIKVANPPTHNQKEKKYQKESIRLKQERHQQREIELKRQLYRKERIQQLRKAVNSKFWPLYEQNRLSLNPADKSDCVQYYRNDIFSHIDKLETLKKIQYILNADQPFCWMLWKIRQEL